MDLVSRLQEFYELNNPDVLADEVEELAAFYAGRDVSDLNSMLRNKYQGHDLSTLAKKREEWRQASSTRRPLAGVFEAATPPPRAGVAAAAPDDTIAPRDLQWEWQKASGIFMKKVSWEPFSDSASADLQAAADAALVQVELRLQGGETAEAKLDTMQFRRVGAGAAGEWVALRTPRVSRWQYLPGGSSAWCAFDQNSSAVLDATHASSSVGSPAGSAAVAPTRIQLQTPAKSAKVWHEVNFDDMVTSVDGNEMPIRPPPRPQSVRLPLTGHKRPPAGSLAGTGPSAAGPRPEEVAAQRRAKLKSKIFLKVYLHETKADYKVVDCTEMAEEALAAAGAEADSPEFPSSGGRTGTERETVAAGGVDKAVSGADIAVGETRMRGGSFSDAAAKRVEQAAGLLTVRMLREIIAEKLQITDAGADCSNYGLYLVKPPLPGAVAAVVMPGGGATGRKRSTTASAAPAPAALSTELMDEDRPLRRGAEGHEFGYANMSGSNGYRLVYRTRCYYWHPGPGGLGLSFHSNGLTVNTFSPPVDKVQGQAEACGLVCIGDQLVQVNGRDMTGLTLTDAMKCLHDAWQDFQRVDNKPGGRRPLALMFRALGKGKRRKGQAQGTPFIRRWLSEYFKKYNPAFLKLKNPRPYAGDVSEDDTALELAVTLFQSPKRWAALGAMLKDEYGEDLETFMRGSSSASSSSPSGRPSPGLVGGSAPSPPQLLLPGGSAATSTIDPELPGSSSEDTPRLTGAFARAANRRRNAPVRPPVLATDSDPDVSPRPTSPSNLRGNTSELQQLMLAQLLPRQRGGGADPNWQANLGRVSVAGLPEGSRSSALEAYRDLYLRNHSAEGDAAAAADGSMAVADDEGSGAAAERTSATSDESAEPGRRKSLVARGKAWAQKRALRRSNSGQYSGDGDGADSGRNLQKTASRSSLDRPPAVDPEPSLSLRRTPGLSGAAASTSPALGGSMPGAGVAGEPVNMRLRVAREIKETETTYLARLNALG